MGGGDLHAGPHAWAESTATNWAICQAPHLFLQEMLSEEVVEWSEDMTSPKHGWKGFYVAIRDEGEYSQGIGGSMASRMYQETMGGLSSKEILDYLKRQG